MSPIGGEVLPWQIVLSRRRVVVVRTVEDSNLWNLAVRLFSKQVHSAGLCQPPNYRQAASTGATGKIC